MSEHISLGYMPRAWQREVHENRRRYSILVLHRRAGKTFLLVMEAIQKVLTCDLPNPRVALIYPQRDQGRRVAWDMLKEMARKIPSAQIFESDLKINFNHNGARIQLFGTHDNQAEAMRGQYFDLACFDEYAHCDPKAWTEIVNPALRDRKGQLILCGTPQGRDNFYDAWQKAGLNEELWYRFILKASESGIIPNDELEDSRQMMDESAYQREYECEFGASPAGAYYASEIKALKDSDRFTELQYLPHQPIFSAMDIGVRDSTVMWSCQIVGTSIHIFDCVVWSDTSLVDIARDVRALPYAPMYLGLPHDMSHREQTSNAPKYEALINLIPGCAMEVLPRLDVNSGVFLVKSLFPQMKFDMDCGDGLEYLATYKRKFNRDTQQFTDKPHHDLASDYADGLRYLCVMLDQLAGGDGTGTGSTIDGNLGGSSYFKPPRVVGGFSQ